MRFSQFKKYIRESNMKLFIDINNLEAFRNKHTKLVKDNRTHIKDGYPHVYPIGETKATWVIVCPYCGEVHSHGKVTGHRTSHCEKNDNIGYVIEYPV